jgi:hypothetical protein
MTDDAQTHLIRQLGQPTRTADLMMRTMWHDAADADRFGTHPFDVVTVNGMTSCNGLIQYLGKATRQPDGTWQAIAITPIGIARVEVTLRFDLPDHDPGDEDPKARR